jgi:hypothetical protein
MSWDLAGERVELPNSDGTFTGAFLTRSNIDPRVWVPHIPDTDIDTSENNAGGIRKVKAYVEQKVGPGRWERADGGWEYRQKEKDA